jgi:hypothetical protein
MLNWLLPSAHCVLGLSAQLVMTERGPCGRGEACAWSLHEAFANVANAIVNCVLPEFGMFMLKKFKDLDMEF